MKARILWIEGKRADRPSFVPALRKKEFLIETLPTGAAALARLPEFEPDLIVVNAASLRTSGARICSDLRTRTDGTPILLIANPEQPAETEVAANVVLKLPFTVRKLINRLAPLLPSDGGQVLQAGAVQLDLQQKLVRCLGKETRLTPRLTHLLQTFLSHPGEVLEREKLFREVWNTEYTGDTRSLDVHISWLRRAIEPEPRKPQFLKTVRGVGYRLDAA